MFRDELPPDGDPGAGGAGLNDLASAARAADQREPAPGIEADTPPKVEGDGHMSREAAEGLARLGLDWVAAALTKRYPVLNYPEETRSEGARLAAAVIVKYPVMRFAARWQAEFELGAFVVGVAWKSYQLVVAERAKAAPPASDSSQ